MTMINMFLTFFYLFNISVIIGDQWPKILIILNLEFMLTTIKLKYYHFSYFHPFLRVGGVYIRCYFKPLPPLLFNGYEESVNCHTHTTRHGRVCFPPHNYTAFVRCCGPRDRGSRVERIEIEIRRVRTVIQWYVRAR
jgi:hypothetical protein